VQRRRIIFGWTVFMLLLAAASTAMAANRQISYVVLDNNGVQELRVSTPLADYILSEDGGVMKSAFLSFAPYGSNVVELVQGTTTNTKTMARQYVADAVFPFTLTSGDQVEGEYDLTAYDVDPETGIFTAEFVGQLAGATVTKRYTIYPDAIYTVEFELDIDNPTSDDLPLSMTLANYVPTDKTPDLYYLFDDTPGSQLLARGSYVEFNGLGLMDKQTVFFLTPEDTTQVSPFITRTASGAERVGIELTAAPGYSTSKSTLYSGRRRYLLMQRAGIETLDNPGIGARLMIPVIQFLDLLYRATGNYGWAIILFTILMRLILYPLMRKQFHSMAKMQRLQPKLKKIQERYKDDKQLLQQRMMELYRKEGVNPMGGCLPMLIQLPIIFVIWRAILYSGESIHLSPGFLWIPDLSLADPYFILVIVTTGIMILQQWLMTPKTATEGPAGTKYFGYIFPIFMAILLWQFPAGLWLYYLLTTGSQVAQQAIVNRELAHADRAAALTGADVDLEEEAEDADDGRTEDGG
jgi:YidC/Oxa1 family membrane protein insertase